MPGAGSFDSLSSLRDRASSDRDERATAEAAAKAAADKEKADADRKKQSEPPVVVHRSVIHDDMTVEDLEKHFKPIFDQVKDKTYLLRGFVTHETKVGASVLSLRSLRKGEHRVIALLSEGEVDSMGVQQFYPDDMHRWSIIFSLAAFGQQTFDPLPVPSVGSSKRFVTSTEKQLTALLDSDEMKKRVALVDSWGIPVYQLVLSNFIDMTAAYQQAILRDLKNPS